MLQLRRRGYTILIAIEMQPLIVHRRLSYPGRKDLLRRRLAAEQVDQRKSCAIDKIEELRAPAQIAYSLLQNTVNMRPYAANARTARAGCCVMPSGAETP